MKTIINQNFNPQDVHDLDFKSVFKFRRRDSNFSYVFKHKDHYYSLRDHLGIAPLFYRWDRGWKFSTKILDLIKPGDKYDPKGLKYYLGKGTSKLHPPIKGIYSIDPGSVYSFQASSNYKRKIYQYIIKPQPISPLVSYAQLVSEFENLFISAIKNLVHTRQVGLMLSGGIDSALIGYYLHKLGISITAYTQSTWGVENQETKFAKHSAKTIQADKHHIDYLDQTKYDTYFSQHLNSYNSLFSNPSTIGINSLLKNTPIASERQVFIGQNCDNLTCSMPMQNWCYFASWLPKPLRALKKGYHNDLLTNYINMKSIGFFSSHPFFSKYYANNHNLNRVQLLTLASLLITNAPWASSTFYTPLVNKGVKVSNPYWNMDLIEWYLSVPLHWRLSFTTKPFPMPVIEKTLVQTLAARFLPIKQVGHKKGYNIPLDSKSKDSFFENLPTKINSHKLKHQDNRFAAAVLKLYVDKQKLPPTQSFS